MKNIFCKIIGKHRFYKVISFMISLVFLVQTGTANSTSKIYLIRHAKVDLKNPGWGTSKNSAEYKKSYNLTGIKKFNPEKVLQKIENHKYLDTVFCSPQARALETAMLIFGENVEFKTDSVLTELDYPVVKIPVLKFPVKGWLFISRITWMAGLNQGETPGYRKRLDELSVFVNELINFAQRNDMAVVVAHGFLNHEIAKFLKNQGWEYCENGKEGHGNLSVNCLEYFD